MDVLQGSPAHAGRRPVSLRPARAGVTDPDHQHLGPKRLEAMQLLEVLFELLQERILEVEDALAALAVTACALLAACGTGAHAEPSTPTAEPSAIPVPADTSSVRLLDWPQFGLDPQRSDVSGRSTGITAANVRRLRRTVVHVGGTVDSSPIYLHGVRARGAVRNLATVRP